LVSTVGETSRGGTEARVSRMMDGWMDGSSGGDAELCTERGLAACSYKGTCLPCSSIITGLELGLFRCETGRFLCALVIIMRVATEVAMLNADRMHTGRVLHDSR
jgi:hypothetical protein